MQFIDLKKQQKRIESAVYRRIQDVLNHGAYIMGPEVFELEEKLAIHAGVKHCVSCSSGTDALLMALLAYGVGPGDAVLTTPFTFVATAEAIALTGATPVFVDICEDTFNIDPEKLRDTLIHIDTHSPPGVAKQIHPRAIIAVDLFGLPADYDRINRIADEFGIFVLEDAAQSFGGLYKAKSACSLADIAATSFFPAKPLGCYGDGGAVFTDDDEIAERLRSIRVHGQGEDKYTNIRLGINGRLDTIQAAILLEKLTIFESEIEARQQVAQMYSRYAPSGLKTPSIPDDCRSAWAQYSVRSARRGRIQEALKERQIPTAIYYPIPLHLQKAYKYLGYQEGSFEICEQISSDIFSLPMHPYLQENEIHAIMQVVSKSV